MATPYPCSPTILLKALADLVAPLPPLDRISVGFPGVIRDGRTLTAPHFANRVWRNFPFAAALSKRLGLRYPRDLIHTKAAELSTAGAFVAAH